MKCIRIYGHDQDDGTFKVNFLVHESESANVTCDDWDTITQVLRLRERNTEKVLFVEEGALSVAEGYLKVVG